MSAVPSQQGLFDALPQEIQVPAVVIHMPGHRPPSLDERVARAVRTIAGFLRTGRPHTCSCSFGKDSSVLLDLTLRAARDVLATGGSIHPIIVLHADTLVENPEIHGYAKGEIEKVKAYAKRHGIPLEVHIAEPYLKESWAVRVIGGTALPTFPGSKQRDCSTNLKIRGMERLRKRLLRDLTTATGMVPLALIGTRFEESAERNQRGSTPL